MSHDIVLRVENLSKRFKLYRTPWRRALEWASLGQRTYHTDFWAIRDISFEVRRGQFLGIIGVNGAGKSTLLKIISGAMDASAGRYQADTPILPLLGLGLDLKETLTGRENVLTNTQLLGLPPRYAQERMPQIAAFAELGDFFDRRVATYSTGMRMRLTFAMFAFLETDLLILDEVMAVGDIFFQQKCYARLNELIARNTAIILVTHDLTAIQQYCHEVIVLHEGAKIFQGRADEAVKKFVQARGTRTAKNAALTVKPEEANAPLDLRQLKTGAPPFTWPPDEAFLITPPANRPDSRPARFIRVAVCDRHDQPCQVFRQGETAVFYYEFVVEQTIGAPIGSLEISNAYNLLLHSKTSLQHQIEVPVGAAAGSRVRFRQVVQMNLAPGEYTFTLGLLTLHPELYANLANLSQQDLNEKTVWLNRVEQAGALVVTPGLGLGMAVLHGGLCDLPGECQVQVEPQAGEP